MYLIKISELDDLPFPLSGSDFMLIVDSGSLITYETSIDSIKYWFNSFGSSSMADFVPSASWASSSLYANLAPSSSYSTYSLYAITTSMALNFFNKTFVSYSLSSSWASESISASNSDFALYSLNTPPLQEFSLYSISSSWASQSLSSSYAITASYPTTSASFADTASYVNWPLPLQIRAWGRLDNFQLNAINFSGGALISQSASPHSWNIKSLMFISSSRWKESDGWRPVNTAGSFPYGASIDATVYRVRVEFLVPLEDTNYSIIGSAYYEDKMTTYGYQYNNVGQKCYWWDIYEANILDVFPSSTETDIVKSTTHADFNIVFPILDMPTHTTSFKFNVNGLFFVV
jgi:hypothetical protein